MEHVTWQRVTIPLAVILMAFISWFGKQVWAQTAANATTLAKQEAVVEQVKDLPERVTRVETKLENLNTQMTDVKEQMTRDKDEIISAIQDTR